MRLKKGYMLLAALSVLSCGKDNSAIISAQRTAIVNYLNRQMSGGEVIPYWQQNGVYVSIPNSGRDGRDSLPQAEHGDRVTFNFVGQVFTTAPQGVFFTNLGIPEADTVLNHEHWPTDPQIVILGTTPLIKGLEDGLPGSRTGDSVVLYLTSDKAYGGKSMGVVPQNSALMFILDIKDVNKKL